MNIAPDISIASPLVQHEWYKDAVIYQLHVKAFADSNDDGIGDFDGLTQRLDYLQDLGVTAVWLLPFYPSPGRDDGYDIADYRRINADFGTMGAFRRFMSEAKKRGLRIITELVINHTSDQHPWFKRARRSSRGSNARDWYVWSDTDQKYLDTRIIFTDTEKSNWAWDPVAGSYYWHRFFSHQPDLNFANPQVFAAIINVMRRWLDAGVDGFRLDAIPYLCEREGTTNENLPETHDVIRRLRAEVEAYAPGTVLLAEANQWPEDVANYFGNGDECHMAYHFPLMPRIYMAIAQEDRFPITDILRQTPDIPQNCQWALFLRNHDELTLEMVTDVERDYLWSTYANDPRARINLGIRRRLAPLMDNDRRKIELMNSLLLSFPGTPIIYYGDEIGMGDNIYLGDRNGVRTPMQWTSDRNGGFSRCDPGRLFLPPIMDPVYGYNAVNVEAQARSLSSLLSWTKRMIAVRKSSPVFGRGSLSFVQNSNRAVLAYVREHMGEVILCVANLSRSAQATELDLSAWKGRVPIEMIGRTRFGKITERPFVITLAPYGFFWLLIREPSEDPASVELKVPEWVTLVFSNGWKSLNEGRTKKLFEHEVLPPFLLSRRWFAQKEGERLKATLDAIVPLSDGGAGAFSLVTIEAGKQVARYSMPLALGWNRVDRHSDQHKATLLAPVRRGNREGVLTDAAADRDFVMSVVRGMQEGVSVSTGEREVLFHASREFQGTAVEQAENIRLAEGEQSNSTVLIGSVAVLKFYRQLSEGVNPEVEIGEFLNGVSGFRNAPPLLGTVQLIEGKDRYPLAVMHAMVANQGDAWSLTSGYLDRSLDEQRILTVDPVPGVDKHSAYMDRMRLVGRRLGELHLALSSRPDVPAFAPEPTSAADLRGLTERLLASATDILDRLSGTADQVTATAREPLQRLLADRAGALDRIRNLLPAELQVDKIRGHGDLHLGQILIVKDDAYIIDFEGEPHRSKEERRRKFPSARDVAGMMRSLDYAATAALQRALKAPLEDHAKLDAFVEEWRTRATATFYAGVREAVGPGSLWPQDEKAANQLLRFFIAEKAFYEISYELANRPEWLSVPLVGAYRALFGEGETP